MPKLDYSVTVRSHLRLAAKIPALIVGPPIIFALLAGGILIAWKVPLLSVRTLVPLVMWGVAILLGYHMIHTFSWVEFDGQVLRAKHLYTQQVWEFDRGQILNVRPLYAAARGHAVNVIIDQVLGPIRGYEIQLAGRRRGITMAVGDSANAAEVANAVAKAIGKTMK